MADERKNDEQPTPHYEGGLPILPGPADREEAERTREKEDEREYKNRQTSTQFGILVTQAVLVFFGIMGAGISFYQATTARQSADQAKRAADLASDSFDAAYGENGISERTMSQIITQTTAQVQSAQAAHDAVTQSQEFFNLQNRPWLIFTPGIVGPEQVGHVLPVESQIENVGSTPAANAWIRAHYDPSQSIPNKSTFDDTDEILKFPVGTRQRIPYQTYIPVSSIHTFGPSGSLYGWIVYRDVFKRPALHISESFHLTEFGVRLVSDLSTPSPNQPVPVIRYWETIPELSCFDRDCKDYNDRIHDAEFFEKTGKTPSK